MASGIGVEMEGLGAVALFGVILIPGMHWIGNAKNTGARLGRFAIVAGLIGAALALEITLDRSVESVVNEMGGSA
jgi:hypothetical protein